MAFVCENARVLRAFFDRPPTRGREQTKCSYEIFRALPKGARGAFFFRLQSEAAESSCVPACQRCKARIADYFQ